MTRYVSLAALAAVLVVTTAIVLFTRHLTINQLTQLGESQNVALTQAFANSIWPEFSGYVRSAAAGGPERMRTDGRTAALDRAIRGLRGDLPILKVKIYDLNGVTVYSSDPQQIGEDKRANPGFLSARAGRVASELTHRGSFASFDRELFEVEVLSSYVPVREGGAVAAVIETYSDVSAFMAHRRHIQFQVAGGLILAFGLLYGVLFLIVRRAARIMTGQQESLRLKQAALEAKTRDLEQEVARRAAAEADANTAQQEAERANRSKSAFLTNMSHELRTPLNAVIGFAELIEQQIVGPIEQPRYIGYAGDIRQSGLHLLDIINDILDLSKIEAGKHLLHEETCDVPELFAAALRLIAERARSGGVQIEVRPMSGLPYLCADPRAVKQMLLNLLSNAVKFTPEGGKVTVGAECDAAGLRLHVADTGIGMSPHDLAIAFEAFGQIDSALNRKYGGTGLGLPLVKALIDMHGGSIDVTTAPGAGTTVTLRFPRSRAIDALAA